jgi:hypothetical protein
VTDMPEEIWVVPDMNDVPRGPWDCGVWRDDMEDALDIHSGPVVKYVRADIGSFYQEKDIDALIKDVNAVIKDIKVLISERDKLRFLLTEIRDLTVERRDHVTMDEAEAVMRWTLWEAVLEDIKKVMGEQE